MTKKTENETHEKTDQVLNESTGLSLMRKPFPPNQISKLPKPTKAQTDALKDDYKNGIRCKVCGGWHHKDVIHLDYVGHAALTDRLLDCDPNWFWEPLAFQNDGTPQFDKNGGLWIRLTVCGVTRLGYGHPDGKNGGDAIKEAIGDALRNAAMRFGAALDLWHKGQLHNDESQDPIEKNKDTDPLATTQDDAMKEMCARIKRQLNDSNNLEILNYVWKGFEPKLSEIKSANPKWYAALELEYKKKTTFFVQTPPAEEDTIPY